MSGARDLVPSLYESFQYHNPNLSPNVVAGSYTEYRDRFYNTNFRVLLIKQFNRVLISSPQWNIVILL
jgi:hypothetical protein